MIRLRAPRSDDLPRCGDREVISDEVGTAEGRFLLEKGGILRPERQDPSRWRSSEGQQGQ